MHIVIDLQGAQSHSRLRGIGRYSLSLAQAIVRNRGEHEITLVLSGLLPDAILDIRQSFEGLMPQERIVVWHAPGPVNQADPLNHLRRECAQMVREAFIASLKPDLVHIMSLFEGFTDNAVSSIGKFDTRTPVSVILYDLIPLLNPEHYLQKRPLYEQYYLQKIDYLKRANLCLAISESSRQEGLSELGLDQEYVINISTAGEAHFKPLQIDKTQSQEVKARYSICRPFLMYTGGIDYRKNLDGLIHAYALLPSALREGHQLLIVCSISDADRLRLMQTAKQFGLSSADLIFTGRVSESDLVLLYNLCTLFIFPSLHEGFGLPVLEAMACGAPVIASNTSSLPEVLGNSQALFDPYDHQAIADKIEQVLGNESLRWDLAKQGLIQAGQFSWDRSARLAIEAWERFDQTKSQIIQLHDCGKELAAQPSHKPTQKLQLAFLSPLPPAKSGISDYSAQLLPELAKYYAIEVITLQAEITDSWVLEHCTIRTIDWFLEHQHQYDRVLYHFGNSTVHGPLFELLAQVPGVVVLHDFYLSGLCAERDALFERPGSWAKALYHSHGYHAVFERYHASDTAQVVWDYPCNLEVLEQALGVIVHSDHSRQLIFDWYGNDAGINCKMIPLLRVPAKYETDQSAIDRVIGLSSIEQDRRAARILARSQLNLAQDDFVVCSFGMLGKSKLNDLLLQAWNVSQLAHSAQCQLIFVGECADPDYEQILRLAISQSPLPTQIHITGWTSAQQFTQYLEAADIAVQLRARSRGETSAAVLDCLNYGLPTIVNAHGSMATFSKDQVYRLEDQCTPEQLGAALHDLWTNLALRQSLSTAGYQLIQDHHSPSACALAYVHAIEQWYECKLYRSQSGALPAALGTLLPSAELATWGRQLAQSITRTFAPQYAVPQILVDISELVTQDSKTGIQRVVRSVLNQWLQHPPKSFRIEPVYASEYHGYRYARRYTLKFLGCPDQAANELADEPIAFYAGDRFVGLDLQPNVVKQHAQTYQAMREQGVRVQFVVYDLLPFLMPQFFYPGADRAHRHWLSIVAQSDSLLCISRAVANEVIAWKQSQQPVPACEVSWFHLGADVRASVPTTGLPQSASQVLEMLQTHTTFLMVGTLEPRKGHELVVRAFENLWVNGHDYCLVIVGKPGWLNERFMKMLEHHPERERHLFWLDAISDEYLEKLYLACDCLIAASEGEGFGLPLIEAAQHQVPIIARDIPVFREVAGEHAFYFADAQPQSIAQAIEQWMTLYAQDMHPKSSGVAFLSWEQSAQQLLELALPERKKPKLAFISPLPPEHTGIAQYAGDLLPLLAQNYEIVLVHNAFAQDPTATQLTLPIRSLAWFENHADQFDRVLYQFGNSPFHSHMLGLLRRHPGVVVLHDFFLSGLWEYCELASVDPHAWSDALYYSHGYTPLLERFVQERPYDVRNHYPANLEVLELATGIIVHSRHAMDLANQWYGPHFARHWHYIPLVRTPAKKKDRLYARQALGIDPDAFVVCSFGFIAPTKLSRQLVDAWLASDLAKNGHCHLFLVGQNHGGAYGQELTQAMASHPLGQSVHITGWADGKQYEQYLQAADLAVQLRSDSRGETSAAVLDCLNAGLPTIVNRHGSMAEIETSAVYALDDQFASADLVQALQRLYSDHSLRERLSSAALQKMRYQHHPRSCAAQYAAVLEACAPKEDLLFSPAWQPNLPSIELGSSLSQPEEGVNGLPALRQRQLLIDVSEIACSDLHSGIERVVRAQLAQLMAHPPKGFRVEPVILGEHEGHVQYLYARDYVTRLYDLPLPSKAKAQLPVRVQAGDIFYGADFCPLDVIKAADAGIYDSWQAVGVKISFLVYDLLPMRHPEFFPPTVDERHLRWLESIAKHAHHLIAISQAVAKDLQDFIAQAQTPIHPDLKVDWVHQGADVSACFPTQGLPNDAAITLEKMAQVPTFLMVGTLEPRKGILQTLAAFDRLWAKGLEVQLMLVGKEGWVGLQPEQRRTLPQIMQTLRHHPQLGRRLWWLPEVSDEFLQKLYGAATALLMASQGEGFGLPLIEAAAHNCAILARDLPVFREIAGDYATYFSGESPEDLSAAVELCLAQYAGNRLPSTQSMSYLSWQDNVAQILKILQAQP